jgi:thiol-disulfide isomerase/thioredoxin
LNDHSNTKLNTSTKSDSKWPAFKRKYCLIKPVPFIHKKQIVVSLKKGFANNFSDKKFWFQISKRMSEQNEKNKVTKLTTRVLFFCAVMLGCVSVYFWKGIKWWPSEPIKTSEHVKQSAEREISVEGKESSGVSVATPTQLNQVKSESNASNRVESVMNQNLESEKNKNKPIIDKMVNEIRSEMKRSLEDLLIHKEKTLPNKMKVTFDLNEFEQLHSQSPDHERVVMAIPIFLNEDMILECVSFMNGWAKTAKNPSNVLVSLVTSPEELTQLNGLTDFVVFKEGKHFNAVSIFHKGLGRYLGFQLPEIIKKKEAIFAKFNPVERIESSDQFNRILSTLQKDQLCLMNCGDQLTQTSKWFNEFVFDNDRINSKNVFAFSMEPNNPFKSCQEGKAYAYFKGDDKSIASLVFSQNESSIESTSDDLAKQLNQVTVFDNPFVASMRKRFHVRFHVDFNKSNKNLIKHLKEIVKQTQQELGDNGEMFQFHLIPETAKHSQSDVTAFDAEYVAKQMHLRYQNKDRDVLDKALKDSPNMLTRFGDEFTYDSQSFDKQSLMNFCNQLIEGNAKIEQRTQKPPIAHHVSRKVVGLEFKEKILDNQKDQVVFYFSHHCGSCKKFLPIFEDLAKESLEAIRNRIIFNRINNEKNQSPFQEYNVTTPKIFFYKVGAKSDPFEYRSEFLTKKMLKDFINTTLEFDLVSNWKHFRKETDKISEALEESKSFVSRAANINA